MREGGGVGGGGLSSSPMYFKMPETRGRASNNRASRLSEYSKRLSLMTIVSWQGMGRWEDEEATKIETDTICSIWGEVAIWVTEEAQHKPSARKSTFVFGAEEDSVWGAAWGQYESEGQMQEDTQGSASSGSVPWKENPKTKNNRRASYI